MHVTFLNSGWSVEEAEEAAQDRTIWKLFSSQAANAGNAWCYLVRHLMNYDDAQLHKVNITCYDVTVLSVPQDSKSGHKGIHIESEQFKLYMQLPGPIFNEGNLPIQTHPHTLGHTLPF